MFNKFEDNVGLVLEGGGMRGSFTSGVLDFFLENKIYINYVIGTSAGASNSISYISHQKGRAKKVNLDYLDKYKYITWKNILSGKSIMDYDFLFKTVPEKLYPLDFDTFFRNPARYISVATNCKTGEAVYFEKANKRSRAVDICRASCSLPMLCNPIFIDGIPYLDGGVSDSIPLKKSILDGNSKNIVVLTRHYGYRKYEKFLKLPFFIYRQYPKLKEKFKFRNFEYNRSLEHLESLEREGKIFVIRPSKNFEISRLERNTKKLLQLYENAQQVCFNNLDKLKKYLEI